MRPEVDHGQGGEAGTILMVVPSVNDARRQEVPVELMIALPLAVPDEAALDLAELEERVQAWGQALMRQALATAWAAPAALRPQPPCPACGGAVVRPAGSKPRKVETGFGPVWLRRPRVRCAGCGRYFQPDDAVLGPTLGAGRLSPRLTDLAALCGASWPYRQAAQVLSWLRGAPLAPETVRAVVAQVGQRVATTQARVAAAVCAPASRTNEPSRPVPPEIAVELDGAWVAAHDNPHGIEVKVGVVHTGSEAVGRTRRRLRQRRSAATTRGAGVFLPLMTAAIEHHNGFAAPKQTLLGDGAGWIWRFGDEALPEADDILDRWHLRQARQRALRAVLPDKEARAPWRERLETVLEVGDVPGALALLAELATQTAAHPAVDDFAGYLTALAPRIPDYAARRAAGERIGSGAIEKGVDLVANRRLKGKRGMRWWRSRVEGVTALRVTLLNNDWERDVGPALTPHVLPAF